MQKHQVDVGRWLKRYRLTKTCRHTNQALMEIRLANNALKTDADRTVIYCPYCGSTYSDECTCNID